MQVTERDARAAYAQAVRQLTAGAPMPAFEEVRRVMFDRAIETVVDREMKRWLIELRRAVPIDVRL